MPSLGRLLDAEEPLKNLCFTYILPRLILSDLIRLSRVSRNVRRLIHEYLDYWIQCIDLSAVGKSFSWQHFWLLFRNNRSTIIEFDLTNCTWIDPRANLMAAKFIRHQPSLRTLRLSSGFHLTEQCLRAVIANNLEFLTVLTLAECCWLTGDTLAQVAQACPRLSALDLAGCWSLTDECIRKLIAIRGDSIRRLRLARIYSLTDTSCTVITARTPRLIHLDISFCGKITDQGIRKLCQHPMLKRIEAMGCANVTRIGWQCICDSNLG